MRTTVVAPSLSVTPHPSRLTSCHLLPLEKAFGFAWCLIFCSCSRKFARQPLFRLCFPRVCLLQWEKVDFAKQKTDEVSTHGAQNKKLHSNPCGTPWCRPLRHVGNMCEQRLSLGLSLAPREYRFGFQFLAFNSQILIFNFLCRARCDTVP